MKAFDGRLAFCSNFYPFEIIVDGLKFPTSEHAFAAGKTDDPDWIQKIQLAPTPASAKRIGKKCPMKDGWGSLRIDRMRKVLSIKFAAGNEMAKLLIATGDEELVEHNTWGDKFFGVYNGVGENWLGKLLMDRRKELISKLSNQGE
jgi:ribA/ribD-fused uncharacterized protein